MKTLLPTLLIILSVATATADEDAASIPRTISVTGEGTAAAPPDLASITTGVVTSAATAGAALEANTAAMETLMATLEAQGIAARDIQTSNFSVSPQYARNQGAGQRPKITGYQVTNNVRIRVRALEKLGALLDKLVEAGSNQVHGISFSIDDPEELLREAREKAVGNARTRAELYARAAGVRVGKVLTISEQAVTLPRPQYMERAAMSMKASAVPVAAGEQELRATVHLVYAIDDE